MPKTSFAEDGRRRAPEIKTLLRRSGE